MFGSRTSDSRLDDYRIGSAPEIHDYLQQIITARSLVNLSGPHGQSYTTLLWEADPKRQTLCFSARDADAQLQGLLECGEVTVTAYLDSIKIQFDLDSALEVHGAHHDTLKARYPKEIFRFQRRSSFRVQPMVSKGPVARFRHPSMPDMNLSLRVLDVSLGGVALFLPDDVPMIAAGLRIGQCELALDDTTEIEVGLMIHHITAINPESRGARLGCELLNVDDGGRALQHYINQTQKRRLALAAERRG